MADTKISALTSLTYDTVDATNDVIPIVDTSAAITKKISPIQLALGMGSTQRAYNAIIGGDFSTNPWQRGTSFAAWANGTYGPDRFGWALSGSGAVTASKSADAPTVAQCGVLATHCLLVDCTTADAAIAAGDIYFVVHKVEGYNFLPLAQKAMTLSFWHKHTKTGTYCVSFLNSGSDRAYVAEYTQAVTDTWELATITISASPSGGTWDYTNGTGLQIGFAIAMGSTYQTTANAWQSGAAYFATSNQVNGLDNTANNFRIALVQLEPGSVATPFAAKPYDDVLQACRRYYTRLVASAAYTAFATGFCSSTSSGSFALKYPTTMRTSPSIAQSNTGINHGSQEAFSSFGTSYVGIDSAFVSINVGGTPLTVGDGCIWNANNNAAAYIEIDAEL